VTRIHSLSSRLRIVPGLAGRFAAERHAVAAVEFALILPVVLTLYLGMVETYRLLHAQRMLTLAARTTADLTTQDSFLSVLEINKLFLAGTFVAGYPVGGFNAFMTSVTITPDAAGATNANIASPDHLATVCWAERSNGGVAGRYKRGDAVGLDVVPGNLRLPRTSLIVVEVEMPFKAITNFFPLGDRTLNAKVMMRPRKSVFVSNRRPGLVNHGLPSPQLGPC
jgi:Flp pilus assembly protein TadG